MKGKEVDSVLVVETLHVGENRVVQECRNES